MLEMHIALTPKPARPKLAEGLSFFLSMKRTGPRQGQCFDKLSTNSFGVATLQGCAGQPPTSRPRHRQHRQPGTRTPYCTSREDCTTVWNSCESAAEMSPLVPTVCIRYDPSALRVAQDWSWLWMLGTWPEAKVLKVGCAV